MQVIEEKKKKRVCQSLRKCKFMFLFTLVSYILNTYGGWMIIGVYMYGLWLNKI